MHRITKAIFYLICCDKHYWGIIFRNIKNTFFDLFYTGRFLGGSIRPINDSATFTQSTDYSVLSKVFTSINVSSNDSLVDVGCGKGRVIAWWLNNGYSKNKIIGTEINSAVAKETKRLFEKYSNVSIIEENIIDSCPVASIYYLFNPFSEEIMLKFKNKLEKIPGDIKVIYYNCLYLDLFLCDSNWNVETYNLSDAMLGIHNKKYAVLTKNS